MLNWAGLTRSAERDRVKDRRLPPIGVICVGFPEVIRDPSMTWLGRVLPNSSGLIVLRPVMPVGSITVPRASVTRTAGIGTCAIGRNKTPRVVHPVVHGITPSR
jgi:hypothetical protein